MKNQKKQESQSFLAESKMDMSKIESGRKDWKMKK